MGLHTLTSGACGIHRSLFGTDITTSSIDTSKLEQVIRAFEFPQIELAVYRERGYAKGSGVGQS